MPVSISFGPPAARGVTTLMAVGADELPDSDVERAVKAGGLASLALLALGMVSGSRRARDLGLGAAAALGAIYAVSRRTRRVVAA